MWRVVAYFGGCVRKNQRRPGLFTPSLYLFLLFAKQNYNKNARYRKPPRIFISLFNIRYPSVYVYAYFYSAVVVVIHGGVIPGMPFVIRQSDRNERQKPAACRLLSPLCEYVF